MTADEIVRRLAASRFVYDHYSCFFCHSLVNADGSMDEDHSRSCVYALALAYVEANPA